jgi:tRNA (cytidine/uridine-2'-O-)-methyltransferase
MTAMAARWPIVARRSASAARTFGAAVDAAAAARWRGGLPLPPTLSLVLRARARHSSRARAAAPWELAGPSSPSSAAENEFPMRTDLRIVLCRPQIPQNAGNVARSCAATGVPLELVGPLGFRIDDSKLKRAGLDYWHAVCARVYEADADQDNAAADGWPALLAAFDAAPEPKRLVAFTVYGATHYAGPAFTYRPGDWLLFGSETEGLSAQAHDDVTGRGGALVKIPMRGGARCPVRSLNLATSVGVGLYEAMRQIDLEQGGPQVVEPRDDGLWRETPMARARAASGGG